MHFSQYTFIISHTPPGPVTYVSDMREDMCGFVEILHFPEKHEVRVPPMIELADPRNRRGETPISGAVIGGWSDGQIVRLSSCVV